MHILFIFISLLYIKPAHAYVDMGIGAMLVQGLIAGFMVGLIYCRQILKTIKSFFNKKTKGKAKHD